MLQDFVKDHNIHVLKLKCRTLSIIYDVGGRMSLVPQTAVIGVLLYEDMIDHRSNTPNLKTFALIVSTHPYCAPKFTRHVMQESAC